MHDLLIYCLRKETLAISHRVSVEKLVMFLVIEKDIYLSSTGRVLYIMTNM